MDLPAISLQGLERAQANFERSAGRVALVGSSDADGTPLDITDLSTAAVDFLTARQGVRLNFEVLGSAAEMERQALDLLA